MKRRRFYSFSLEISNTKREWMRMSSRTLTLHSLRLLSCIHHWCLDARNTCETSPVFHPSITWSLLLHSLFDHINVIDTQILLWHLSLVRHFLRQLRSYTRECVRFVGLGYGEYMPACLCVSKRDRWARKWRRWTRLIVSCLLIMIVILVMSILFTWWSL